MLSGPSAGAGGQFDWHGRSVEVIDVWEGTIDEEMTKLRKLVERFPFVAMDTSFPGIVARPLRPLSEGPAKLTARDVEEYHYQSIRLNVDVMPVLQVGLTLFDASGNMPPGGPVWQFNMRFDPTNDLASPFALDQMRRTGLDLERLSREGVPHSRLGEVLMVSGLVLVEGPKWVTFQSGYDMAFLLKLLTCRPLPETASGFAEQLGLYFPAVVDCKCVCGSVKRPALSGGLAAVASALGVPRPPTGRQAGATSLLTMGTFVALAKALGTGGRTEGLADLVSRFRHKLAGLPAAPTKAAHGGPSSTRGRTTMGARRR
ncbi:hypothetical protein FNF29_01930 [Cafeteria roenbergensis]|uniref:poly(A)-specific ribonuclease n=1 Tax=Cafeteria roenbergensis TaxID=33653 RepID=A0A5A8CR33_CAFRO|nr:hypothetical protein FNF29_01930 [Cafeteria roenbergensis]KAA0161782.1 hypothetical protein FNF31_03568 [Cafeteria roenbergensis]KAA0169635.1 hypothetical protein FNF28_01913 [Cafeteria roenbergensis]|eukprot:KAA0155179.1 hypothetical protein FNF29_01930 [Cafeteria roenbergensis]